MKGNDSNRKSITISLPQVPIIKGDIAANLATHLSYITQSSALGADLVVFPECSLTGYELTLAKQLAFDRDCTLFKQLSQSAIDNNMTVIAGCPLINSSLTSEQSKPAIGAVICFANGDVEFYEKQYLHLGEDTYCRAGEKDYLFDVAGFRVALAICADFNAPKHAQDAANQSADLYIVSAMISQSGFAPDSEILSALASKYAMPVLLCNHISPTGGWNACGKNSVWEKSGTLQLCTESKQPCILLCTLSDEHLSGQVYADLPITK